MKEVMTFQTLTSTLLIFHLGSQKRNLSHLVFSFMRSWAMKENLALKKKKKEIYNLLSVYKSRLHRCFCYVKVNLNGKKYLLHNIIHSCLYHCVFLSGCTYTFLVSLSKPCTMLNLKDLPTQSCENPAFRVITGLFSLVLQWGNNSLEVTDSDSSNYNKVGTIVPPCPLLCGNSRQHNQTESTCVWVGLFIHRFPPPAMHLIVLVKGRLGFFVCFFFFLKTQQKICSLPLRIHTSHRASPTHPHSRGNILHTKDFVRSFMVSSIHQS